MKSRGMTISAASLLIYCFLFFIFYKRGYKEVGSALNLAVIGAVVGGVISFIDSISEISKRKKESRVNKPD